MAYMRGDYYLWTDVSGLHLWAADGYDSWDESGWHRDDDGKDYPINDRHLENGQNTASGVSIHQEIMDEYVMMRLAELLESKQLDETLERTLAKWERASLHRNALSLRVAFQRASSEQSAT